MRHVPWRDDVHGVLPGVQVLHHQGQGTAGGGDIAVQPFHPHASNVFTLLIATHNHSSFEIWWERGEKED